MLRFLFKSYITAKSANTRNPSLLIIIRINTKHWGFIMKSLVIKQINYEVNPKSNPFVFHKSIYLHRINYFQVFELQLFINLV